MEATSSTPEGPARRAWGAILAWIGGITAVLGFVGTVTGTFTTISEHLHHDGKLDSQIKLAQSQMKQGESSGALVTYDAVLKQDPNYTPALAAQLQAVFHSVDEFELQGLPGEKPEVVAARQLDAIFPVLDAALLRAKGTQAADVQAHLGRAHHLNSFYTGRETEDVAEKDVEAALAIDPNNIYANVFMGRWQVKNGRDFDKGMRHFDTAIATGRERGWVREFEMRSLLNVDDPEPRTTILKVANAMRLGNEPLDDELKQEIITYSCSPSAMFHDQLVQNLKVLPRDDFWQTFLWLDSMELYDVKEQGFRRRALQAQLDETAGQRAKALTEWRAILKDQQGTGSSYDRVARDGIERLSK